MQAQHTASAAVKLLHFSWRNDFYESNNHALCRQRLHLRQETDTPAPHYNENGVLIMSVYDFLLDENSLDI